MAVQLLIDEYELGVPVNTLLSGDTGRKADGLGARPKGPHAGKNIEPLAMTFPLGGKAHTGQTNNIFQRTTTHFRVSVVQEDERTPAASMRGGTRSKGKENKPDKNQAPCGCAPGAPAHPLYRDGVERDLLATHVNMPNTFHPIVIGGQTFTLVDNFGRGYCGYAAIAHATQAPIGNVLEWLKANPRHRRCALDCELTTEDMVAYFAFISFDLLLISDGPTGHVREFYKTREGNMPVGVIYHRNHHWTCLRVNPSWEAFSNDLSLKVNWYHQDGNSKADIWIREEVVTQVATSEGFDDPIWYDMGYTLGLVRPDLTGAMREYRQRCRQVHPDKNGGGREFNDMTVRLNAAKEAIIDNTAANFKDLLVYMSIMAMMGCHIRPHPEDVDRNSRFGWETKQIDWWRPEGDTDDEDDSPEAQEPAGSDEADHSDQDDLDSDFPEDEEEAPPRPETPPEPECGADVPDMEQGANPSGGAQPQSEGADARRADDDASSSAEEVPKKSDSAQPESGVKGDAGTNRNQSIRRNRDSHGGFCIRRGSH